MPRIQMGQGKTAAIPPHDPRSSDRHGNGGVAQLVESAGGVGSMRWSGGIEGANRRCQLECTFSAQPASHHRMH